MMKIHNHARTLAMASMLALAVVTVPATQAFATAKVTTPQPNLCFMDNGGGNSEFYLPGEIFRNREGDPVLICGADGNWHYITGLPANPTQTNPSLPTGVAPRS